MLRKIKQNAISTELDNSDNHFQSMKTGKVKLKTQHLGKRRREQLLAGENNNPNKQVMDRAIISKVKFVQDFKRREKKKLQDDSPEMAQGSSVNTASSLWTAFSGLDKSKRREYQGAKPYRKQKGGKLDISVFKKSLKSERTGKWRSFSLFNESELPGFSDYALQIIENEGDDDCQTDIDIIERYQEMNIVAKAIQKRLNAKSKSN